MSLPPTWDLFGEEHLPHRIQLLAKMVDRETGRQLQREFALSLAEWRVLAFVCAAGSSSAAEVAAGSEIDRAEVSRAAAKLLAEGLIDRAADPTHRKRLILSATARGIDMYTLIRDRRRAYFQQILCDVPASARDPLNAALRSIALRVQQVAGEG